MLIVITLLLTVSFGFGTEEAAQDIGTVIAIDLGTTYSSVGIFRNGRVEIIPNDQGSHITPSYVAFTRDGERLIGDAAKNQLTSNPNNTIFDVKRLIGREFIDPLVQQAIKYYPFAIIERNGKPTIQINVGKAIKHFTPEEISAMILSKMREIAESYLGRKVTDAVVTVPGYFNTRQRQATQDAATIAGLNLLKMISKPNAAAIAYAFCKRDGEHNVLVLNLGGGTFDVSLLTIDNGVIEVVAINGDLCLGGEDFDCRVMEYFMKLFKLKTGKDVRKYDSAMQKLRREVERAKRILSSEHATKIEIESFFGNEDFRETLTRAKFDELNMDLFHATIKPIQKVLEDADLKKTDISEVVLVGGSTRIPKFQQLVKEFFDCKVLLRSMNPDQAAASGAAVFVGVTYGEESTGNIVLLDVYPFTVGFKTVDGLMAKIVPRNTVIPTKKSQIFSTTIDFQQSVKIQVFEGERPMAKDNHFLGEFDLTGISMASKGLWEIAVTIEIDTNHVLKVTAKDTATGKTNNSVMNSNPNRLSPEEIDRMIKASKQFANRDKGVKERVEAKNELECYVYSLKAQLTDTEKLGEKLSSQDKKKIEEVIEEQIAWIESNPGATVDELREHKKQLKDVVTSIVAELYENIDGSCTGNLFTGLPEYPMDCTPDHAHPPPLKRILRVKRTNATNKQTTLAQRMTLSFSREPPSDKTIITMFLGALLFLLIFIFMAPNAPEYQQAQTGEQFERRLSQEFYSHSAMPNTVRVQYEPPFRPLVSRADGQASSVRQMIETRISSESRLAQLIREEEDWQHHNLLGQNILERIYERTTPATAEFIAQFRREHESHQNTVHLALEQKQVFCAICQEYLKRYESFAMWPCPSEQHLFHYDCMLNYLRRKNVCPLCRHEVEGVRLPTTEEILTDFFQH